MAPVELLVFAAKFAVFAPPPLALTMLCLSTKGRYTMVNEFLPFLFSKDVHAIKNEMVRSVHRCICLAIFSF